MKRNPFFSCSVYDKLNKKCPNWMCPLQWDQTQFIIYEYYYRICETYERKVCDFKILWIFGQQFSNCKIVVHMLPKIELGHPVRNGNDAHLNVPKSNSFIMNRMRSSTLTFWSFSNDIIQLRKFFMLKDKVYPFWFIGNFVYSLIFQFINVIRMSFGNWIEDNCKHTKWMCFLESNAPNFIQKKKVSKRLLISYLWDVNATKSALHAFTK